MDQRGVREGRRQIGVGLFAFLLSLTIAVQPVIAQGDSVAQSEFLSPEVAHLLQEGQYAAAITKVREDIARLELALGLMHPDVATGLHHLALLLQVSGDHVAAKPLFERSLAIREQALGPNDPLVAASLGSLGFLLTITRDFAAARPFLERALQIREQALGPAHLEVAVSLGSLALLLQATGDYAAARSLYERALKIYENAPGPTSLGLVATLQGLGGLVEAAGDYAAARPLYERALQIQEQALGPDHPDVATILHSLADVLRGMGDYAGAKPLLERALAIRERTLGANDPLVVESLNALGNLLQNTGDYSAARRLYERALKIAKQALGPDHPDVAGILHNLAFLLQDIGDYAAARPLYEQALTIYQKAGEPSHPDMATVLLNLGRLLQDTGDYAAARPPLERSVEISERTFGATHLHVAGSLVGLGRLLQATGDYAAARPLYERALRISEQALGPTHRQVGTIITYLASLHQLMGDYTAARPLYERALRISELALGPTHSEVADILNDLAYLHETADDYAVARPLYEQALTIYEKALGPSHPYVATALGNLGGVLQTTGDYAAARPLYERALKIDEQVLGQSHRSVALDLTSLALLEWEARRPQEALTKLVRAVGIMRAHTARGLVGLSQRQKLAFLKSTGRVTDTFLSLASGLAADAEAYQAVLDRKNVVYRALAGERASVEANPSPQVAALSQDYTAVRRQLASLTVSIPAPQDPQLHRAQVAALSQRLESLEADLSRASAAVRQAQAEASAGPSEVCAAVPLDAAFIDLFWYGRYVPPSTPGTRPTWAPHYVAFVLRGAACTEPIRLDLGPVAPIDEDVRRLRDALSHDASDPPTRELRARYRKALAARLHARLFPPALREAIAGKPRLIIAPDGSLALLPFALLPGEDGRAFLLETRTISYIPSGRDLLRRGAPTPAVTALLAVGAPAFDRAPVQVVQAATIRAGCGVVDERFVPLPGTAAEVRAIAAISQKAQPTRRVTVLDRAGATKAAFAEEAPKAGILHLATHAYFAGDECAPAGVVSGPPIRTHGDAPTFLGHNPLLLAGIALAGANKRETTDGILTALEITALDLRNTDLVVLSACDTGLGTLARGQELLGLRWAFAYAGAKNLVTSLWSVPDEETTRLMIHFYAALWEKGLSVAEALRLAQLTMLAKARANGDSAPHAWGAFVASGGVN